LYEREKYKRQNATREKKILTKRRTDDKRKSKQSTSTILDQKTHHITFLTSTIVLSDALALFANFIFSVLSGNNTTSLSL